MGNPFKDFTVHVGKGEPVYQEGEPGAMMYVIQSGIVELFREVDSRRISYGVLEKGDFFGEMSLLLESQPRTTNASVLEDAVLVEINATIFDKMIRGNIEIAVRMMRKISLRLREYQERVTDVTDVTGAAAALAAPMEDAGGMATGRVPAMEAPVPTPVTPSAPEATEAIYRQATPAPAVAPAPLPKVSHPKGTFAIFQTQDGATQFPLANDSIAIGRFDPVTGMRPEVDLSAADINRSVSRHHARLVRNGNDYSLTEEVGALNGTFVNGTRLTTGKPAPVRDGDEVGMGMVRLRFQVVEAP